LTRTTSWPVATDAAIVQPTPLSWTVSSNGPTSGGQRKDALYVIRQDHWFQLRFALQRMIRTSDYSARAIARARAKLPPDRRNDFRQLLESFARQWSLLGATPEPRPAITPTINDVTIRSIPHAAAMISSRRYYLRFVYTPRPLRDMPSRMEAQLLRECALRSRAWPALLVVDGAVLIPARRDPQAAVLLSAQAAEYARLWQWAGGR